jgi:hypothetical protein
VAFSHGLDTAALGAAVAMVLAAAFCARFFRGVRVAPDTEPDGLQPRRVAEPTGSAPVSS